MNENTNRELKRESVNRIVNDNLRILVISESEGISHICWLYFKVSCVCYLCVLLKFKRGKVSRLKSEWLCGMGYEQESSYTKILHFSIRVRYIIVLEIL